MPQEADSEMDAGCLLESALGVTPVEGRGGKQHWAEREVHLSHRLNRILEEILKLCSGLA